MIGIFPFGVPYFAQPQLAIIADVVIVTNTPAPLFKRDKQEAPRMVATVTNDKPRIKH